jgi:hypothetical protein
VLQRVPEPGYCGAIPFYYRSDAAVGHPEIVSIAPIVGKLCPRRYLRVALNAAARSLTAVERRPVGRGVLSAR